MFHQLDEGAAYDAHLQVEKLAHEGHEHNGTPAAEAPHDPVDSHGTCLLCHVRVNYAAADPGYSPSAAPLLSSIRAAHHVPVDPASRQNYVRGPPGFDLLDA